MEIVSYMEWALQAVVLYMKYVAIMDIIELKIPALRHWKQNNNHKLHLMETNHYWYEILS